MAKRHSFLFDVFNWREHLELDAIYERLWLEIPKSRQHKATEELRYCLRLFFCNLYVSYYYDKSVAVPLKAEAFSRGRYNKLFIKRVPFVKVFRFLEQKGLIIVVKGKKPYSAGFDIDRYTMKMTHYQPGYLKGSVTRIWASDDLMKDFSELSDVLFFRNQEAIILRERMDKKKYDIPFQESDFTSNLRRELNYINTNLSNHYFLYDKRILNNWKYINPKYDNNNPKVSEHDSNSNTTHNPILLREPNRKKRRFGTSNPDDFFTWKF